MTYQPLIYKTSGGDQLVIASGGVVEFQSGAAGAVTGQVITTTGTITGNTITATSGITASGAIIYAVAGGFREYVETRITSAATLANYGVSIVGTSSGTAHDYKVTPIVGVRKMISCVFTTAAQAATVTSTAAWNAAGHKVITFTTGETIPQYVEAVGMTLNQWTIVNRSTSMTFA